ncbi:MAG: hypothetical protein EKK32_23600 [Bradyrhizobiaceae bacterium]|nr:putative membrane protein of unknown function [Bradyrhizobium sp. BTAi1]RTL96062.1 MAG: hypothetical protein EKK32_23600 [Bradyrhizobiaceae bacterium]
MTGASSRRVNWTIPALLALTTLAGLTSALVGEGGAWWMLSWGLLAVPCLCSILCLLRGLGSSCTGPRARRDETPMEWR